MRYTFLLMAFAVAACETYRPLPKTWQGQHFVATLQSVFGSVRGGIARG